MGVKKTRTTPFALCSNGMVERSNRSIKQMLCHKCCQVWKDDWDEWLPSIRMSLNATHHSTTGYTPFKFFMSQCEDSKLPYDLLYGMPRSTEATCRLHAGQIRFHNPEILHW